MEASNVEHMYRWPDFHADDTKKTINYQLSFMELMHDEEAYN